MSLVKKITQWCYTYLGDFLPFKDRDYPSSPLNPVDITQPVQGSAQTIASLIIQKCMKHNLNPLILFMGRPDVDVHVMQVFCDWLQGQEDKKVLKWFNSVQGRDEKHISTYIGAVESPTELRKFNLLLKLLYHKVPKEKLLALLQTKVPHVEPLHLAAWCGDKETYETFIKASPEAVNAQKKHGKVILYGAVLWEDLDLIKYLVEEHGIQVSLLIKDNVTPLHLAVESGFLSVIEYLLANGADIHIGDEAGHTSLHLAAFRDSIPVVEMLIKAGAQINARNKIGQTPLYEATKRGNLHMFEYLIEVQGADIHALDRSNRTILHEAAIQGYGTIVHYIVAKGVDVKAKDNDGQTAYDLASTPEVRAFLKKVEQTQ